MKIIISKRRKRKEIPLGSGAFYKMQQAVYKNEIGKVNGKMKYSSTTRHEKV